jgi:hypothetical protein
MRAAVRLIAVVVRCCARRPRKSLAGVMQLTVAGESARGTPTTVALKPIALNLGSHEVMRGSLPPPEGLPRQTTVRVPDGVGWCPRHEGDSGSQKWRVATTGCVRGYVIGKRLVQVAPE